LTSWRAGRPAGPLSAFGIAVVTAIVIADQASKAIAEAALPPGEAIELLPILTLYRVHNAGIAFSLLAGFGPSALIWLMLAVSVVVIAFWARSHEGGRLAALGYACIVGGAVGNLIDRVRFGYVIDFLLLHIGQWTLFVFNFADAFLTLGPMLLIVGYIWPQTPDA
jgi:signal peptidase II